MNQNENTLTATHHALTEVFTLEQAFTAAECQSIWVLAQVNPSTTGKTQDPANSQVRDSEIRWIPPGAAAEWVFIKLRDLVLSINQQHYQFEINELSPLQVAEYRPGGHYDWHTDIGTQIESRRKLSVSVQLSPPEDYAGGELEFFHPARCASKNWGSVIVFPSYMPHRVVPVSRGVRRSLVAWVKGPPFR